MKNNGFSLIELLLVISLLVILGTMSTGFMARFLTQNNVSNVSDQLVNLMRTAQMNAMMGKQGSNWSVNYGGTANTITMFVGSTFAGHTTTFDVKFGVSPSISVSGLSTITFSRVTGFPSTTASITISGSGETNTVQVNNQGVVFP